jgi:hypothetical protein
MCLVIRFQLLFGNVRACTLGAYFLRDDRSWRMPLASPLVSPILVKRRSRSAAWPRNETAEYDQRLLEFSAVLIGGFQPPNETAVHT